MKNDNLSIWNKVCTTDPAYTKQYKGPGGFTGTAINAIYMIRRASELWGPVGEKWGYDIIEDRIDDGAPIIDPVTKSYSQHCEKVHTMKICLWYPSGAEAPARVYGYGHTAMVYINKFGVQTEQEPAKKSLTDAIKKCLSMLGFSADIFLGNFDDENYVESIAAEIAIEKAENRDEEIASQQKELSDYVIKHLATIESAASANEVRGITRAVIKHLERRKGIAALKEISEKAVVAIGRKSDEKLKQLETKTNAPL